jgi:hypothetical protein
MKTAESDLERMGASLGGDMGSPAARRNIRYNLVDMPVIAFSSILCGFETNEEIVEFGHLKREWLGTFLELPNEPKVRGYRTKRHFGICSRFWMRERYTGPWTGG